MRITARDFITIAGHDQDGAPSGVFTGTSGSGAAGSLALSVPAYTWKKAISSRPQRATGGRATSC